MTAVELAPAAIEDLDSLIRTHTLPADTPSRVFRRLARLERFPQIGAALTGRCEGFRFRPGALAVDDSGVRLPS